ncbi:iron-containing alcohol dehydrogenase [Aminobacter sp. MSH1]|uniref:iron-containing alcohol dehydrogenase n=1 Tax=Aminobacter sp. MSH1 TaxID=374606 RepID=UPI000D3CFBEB|nr:iron-containing alcohol dehydrogenase [Aminobacter sp. MSH1]
MSYQFGLCQAPSRILFGLGQIRSLGREVAARSDRVLICTDERIAGLALLDEVIRDIEKTGAKVAVFSHVEAELPAANVEACVRMHAGFEPGAVVGLGGGSCIDHAKLVSLRFVHRAPLQTFYGELKVPGPILPVLAVPTTAGTGSEVTPVAVLSDADRPLKVGISSPYLIPSVALCDPDLTISCPPALTAISGADALTHAIEAFSAKQRPATNELAYERVFVGKNALSDANAISAIRLLFRHLPTAVSQPRNVEARSAVMLGSTLAGLAFGTAGTSAAHAIQYPIGALTKSAHGLGVALLLPYAMRFNLGHCIDTYAAIAREIGLPEKDDADAAEAAITAIAKLFSSIGIPEHLGALGVERSQSKWIAEQSMQSKRLVENNPRLLNQNGVLEIVENAFGPPDLESK